jgi:hypothetical protein
VLHVAFAGIAQEILAHLGGAGESDHVHIHVAAKCLSGRFAKARKHVENAVGNAGFCREFCHAESRQRRLFGGLQDHRVAGRKRGSQFP